MLHHKVQRAQIALVAAHAAMFSAIGTAQAQSFEFQAGLTASDARMNTRLGMANDISGDTLISGAHDDGMDPAGFFGSGAAYIFSRRPDGTWIESTKLTPNVAFGDNVDFGWSVAVDGSTAMVAARLFDFSVPRAGGVYVFDNRDGEEWVFEDMLVAPDLIAFDKFGSSIDLDGDTAIIGAFSLNVASPSAGEVAYIFRKTNGDWIPYDTLEVDDDANYGFGKSVSISGDTAVVGAPFGTAPDGTQTGAAYIFKEIDDHWQLVAKINAQNAAAEDRFGDTVSISQGTVVVGAPEHDDISLLDNGLQGCLQFPPSLDSLASMPENINSGAAFVFREIGGQWQQVATLKGDDTHVFDELGTSVAIDGDTAVVSAPKHDVGACDVNNSGAAYVFREIQGQWQQIAKLEAPEPMSGEFLGSGIADGGEKAVAINGDTVAAGVIARDIPFTNSGITLVFAETQATCPADLSGPSGTPDGVLDSNDFFFYLSLFAAGDPDADLTGGPGGAPDGLIDSNDFFQYLSLFAAGCP